MSGNHVGKRAVRHGGLASRRLSRRPVLATAGTGRFVARLLASHALADRRTAGVAQELQRLRVPATVPAQHHWHGGWSPRIALSLCWMTGRGAAVVPREAATAAPSAPITGAPLAPSVVPDSGKFARVDALRVNAAARPATLLADPVDRSHSGVPSLPAPSPNGAMLMQALPRVLRRPAAAAPVEAAPPSFPAATSAGFGGTPAAFANAPGHALSTPALMAAIDVEGLADRVVRVIDRRLVATRERHGRI